MHIWRPKQQIQVKALGLLWQEGKLLASEIHDDNGEIKGVRPLGGCVEFGKIWQLTLVREFKEELDIAIHIVSPPVIVENIYDHYGMRGHEIVFLANIALTDDRDLGCGPIIYQEDSSVQCRADWHDIAALRRSGLPLFPNGLIDRLDKGSVAT